MKLKRNAWCFIGVLVSAIVLMSCSSGGGGGGDPAGGNYEITDRPLTPLTMANLAGTWSFQNYTTTEIESGGVVTARGAGDLTYVINQDGTYLQTIVYRMVSVSDPTDTWQEYGYERGTIYCDGNNIVKEQTGYIGQSKTPMQDPAEAMWVSYNRESTEMHMLFQNRLFTKAFQRVGTGSGIIGTWLLESSSFAHQIVITDTTYTEYTGRYVSSLSLHASATYTLIDDNTLHVSSDKFGEYDMEVILCGDMLVMLNISTSYTKQ